MFSIIKKIIGIYNTNKKQKIKNNDLEDNEYHILLSYDKYNQTLALSIDYESIMSKYYTKNNRFSTEACEDIDKEAKNLADFLYSICNNKTLLASLVLDNLKEYKTLATDTKQMIENPENLLLVNGIVNHIESNILTKTKNIDDHDPIVKPIQVFYNAN